MKPVIAKKLREIRIKKGWSQAFVARQLGLSIRTISRLENCHGLSNRNLERICLLYGTNLKELCEIPTTKSLRRRNIISEETIFNILLNHPFISDIEHESIHQFVNLVLQEARFDRDVIEDIVLSATNKRGTYNMSDVVWCCMVVNMRVLDIITTLNEEASYY
ncbi:helix-turn-helix transcriptional regulator [Pseudobutyrivibrio xylanivorans]|uniref:Helix-turn-helix transcriptional regulator n=2 Tax=Pseudobutyrivibrio xylanivorans TaxID=185007 RepID=A0A5P6VW26_PSEXY|nr:helix-turn-helix transcriptional regulator [Pseudobutyrivibrio xylanivorans]